MTEQFELESLLPEQKNILREFFEGRMFVNLLTGFPVSSKRKRCTGNHDTYLTLSEKKHY